MNKKYDIIVIGGGHNGLTAACTLGRQGKKVLVLEKRELLGGIAAGEPFYPGYRTSGLLHDTSGVRRKVIEALSLEKFGLKTQNERAGITLLSKDGRAVFLDPDVDKAAMAIAAFSQKDAAAYKAYRAFIDRISSFVSSLMDNAPPDMMNLGGKQLWELIKKGVALRKLGNETMLELLKVAPMSVADFLNERFETDFLKAGIAATAIYGSYTGPWSSYTTLNLLLWECAANECITGGPQALVDALEKAALDAGVEIRKETVVEKIVLNANEKVSGVKLGNGDLLETAFVASSCTPKETFYELLHPAQINYSLEQGIRHYRSRGTTAKIHLALNRSIELNGATNVEFARTGNSFDEMEKAFDSVKYREFSREPVLDIHVPSVADPSLAPDGHQVWSVLVHFAPYHFDEGWSEATKNRLLENVLGTLEKYTPDLRTSIVGSEVLSPVDIEQRYSLTEGHIFHGEHAVDQLLTRPLPSCARYKTPIEGLYLCGSGSHPGGGITCMPGYLAAQMILKER